MSECCCPPKPVSSATAPLCAQCGTKGRSVDRCTVIHHVKSELLSQVGEDEYRFCAAPACAVVYYNACGVVFTVKDVRDLVTAKASGDARPLCYCFGFTEGDIRREIAQTGATTVPAQISAFIKAQLCACEVRNPSGACCLGEVNKAAQRLSEKGKPEYA
ncbi:MAG: (2Fe-2S)-binding protein [Acidobacteria bacterium]|nr:(2Fe-2S)-binding protein [Acidobacteriota bacterium]